MRRVPGGDVGSWPTRVESSTEIFVSFVLLLFQRSDLHHLARDSPRCKRTEEQRVFAMRGAS